MKPFDQFNYAGILFGVLTQVVFISLSVKGFWKCVFVWSGKFEPSDSGIRSVMQSAAG